MTATFTPDELAGATGGRWIGAPPGSLAGVSTDTRSLRPGNLFVALRGERFDAHDYLAQAAAAGAAAAVVAASFDRSQDRLRQAQGARPRLEDAGIPLLVVPDTLHA